MKTYYGGAIFTNHALERLRERQIIQQDAWYTFQHPDGQLPGTSPNSIKYYKDYGAQRIEVIAKLNEKKEWIILSCWSKIMGNNQPIFTKKENLFLKILKKLF